MFSSKHIFISVNVAALKRVKLQVESLHSAKLKDEKASKSKKPAKGRTTVKMDLDKVAYLVLMSRINYFLFDNAPSNMVSVRCAENVPNELNV